MPAAVASHPWLERSSRSRRNIWSASAGRHVRLEIDGADGIPRARCCRRIETRASSTRSRDDARRQRRQAGHGLAQGDTLRCSKRAGFAMGRPGPGLAHGRSCVRPIFLRVPHFLAPVRRPGPTRSPSRAALGLSMHPAPRPRPDTQGAVHRRFRRRAHPARPLRPANTRTVQTLCAPSKRTVPQTRRRSGTPRRSPSPWTTQAGEQVNGVTRRRPIPRAHRTPRSARRPSERWPTGPLALSLRSARTPRGDATASPAPRPIAESLTRGPRMRRRSGYVRRGSSRRRAARSRDRLPERPAARKDRSATTARAASAQSISPTRWGAVAARGWTSAEDAPAARQESATHPRQPCGSPAEPPLRQHRRGHQYRSKTLSTAFGIGVRRSTLRAPRASSFSSRAKTIG
jgi:hypothetical protein